MNDDQLLRYSRQIMLPQFDVRGQQRLLDASVLIMGLGGLGSPVSMYLAASGIGHLMLCDFDVVDLSNLQRQIIHFTPDIGLAKVESAKEKLLSINPDIKITAINKKLDYHELSHWVSQADLVVDGSDNFTTRFLVNRVCVENRCVLISGAAIRMEGQVCVFLNNASSSCYRCLYKEVEDVAQTCSENGILSPVVGIIGSIQALEVIKILADIGNSYAGHMLIFDAMRMEWRRIRIPKDPQCPICSKKA